MIGRIGNFGSDYRISSIHGNPYSMYAVQKITRDTGNQRGRAFVIGQKKPKDDLYVKDFGELDKTKSTATGGFAEILSMQKNKAEDTGKKIQDYASYLNDTIGVMGFMNGLRDKLNSGIAPVEQMA